MNLILLTLLIVLAIPLYSYIMSEKSPKPKKTPAELLARKEQYYVSRKTWPNSLRFMAFATPITLIVCIILSIQTGEWIMGILAFFAAVGIGGTGALFLDE